MTSRILNPVTGRWVGIHTRTGQQVLALSKKSQTITTSCYIGTFPTNMIVQLESIGKQCFDSYSYSNIVKLYPDSHYFYTFDLDFNLYAILLLDNRNTIWDVCTNSKYRRQGYQKQLFEYLFKTLRTLKIPYVQLYVEKDNQNAIDLYSKLGFYRVEPDSRTFAGSIRMKYDLV